MTEGEIKGNISYNENLIQGYLTQITKIQGEIEELEALKSKISNFQFDFASRQDSRRSGLSKYISFNLRSNIFSKYITGMSELLNGQEYTNTYNGLTTASERVQNKINEKTSSLTEVENNLSYRRKRKSYWEQQLRNYYATKEN